MRIGRYGIRLALHRSLDVIPFRGDGARALECLENRRIALVQLEGGGIGSSGLLPLTQSVLEENALLVEQHRLLLRLRDEASLRVEERQSFRMVT